jgi:hypothetical protein
MAKGKVFLAPIAMWISGCNSQPIAVTRGENRKQQSTPQETVAPLVLPALLSTSTGGFDGSRAFEHVRHLVELGPRPPGSDAIHRAQSYIIEQLNAYGCRVEEHDFHASTPNWRFGDEKYHYQNSGYGTRHRVRDLQVELKPPDVTPSNFQTRH